MRTIILLITIVFFFLFCLAPPLYLLGISLIQTHDFLALDAVVKFFGDPRRAALLGNSLLLAAASAAVATLIGVPLGLLLARADLPGRPFFRTALAVPLLVPSYILGLAWIYLGGSAGWLARLLGRDLLSDWTYSLPAAIVLLGVNFYPISMLATEAAARRVDASTEEAGLLVTRPGAVFRRITLPLIAPIIGGAALLIFILGLAEFSLAGLLRVRVFSTEIFTAFAARYDFRSATVLAFPLLILALLAGIALRFLVGEKMLATARTRQTGLPFPLGRLQPWVMGGLILWLLASVFLPLFALASEAGQVKFMVNSLRTSSRAISNSLILSVVGATAITCLGLLLGYFRARSQARGSQSLDLLFILIFAVPSTLTGVGLIGLWNRPGFLGEIYTSRLMVLFGYLARFVPVAALLLAAYVRQIPASFEEAAVVAGAHWPRVFTRIVLPQLKTGLLAAWGIGFIFSFGELGVTVLVSPPGESTLPVRIYTLVANTPPSQLASLALMQVGVILGSLGLLGLILNKDTHE
ncbi:MAG: iron ABC transporter permease [Acidobacteria bacterium]|nr:iron ABC transporter permease [Acidobacteriota bacterium]